jgi:inner membrane protein
MDVAHITYWHWWILAIALLILEVVTPGFFFLWIGISAGIVGFMLFMIPTLGWEYQLLIFAFFSVIDIVLWLKYAKKHPVESDQPALNRRGEQYVGRVFTLQEGIVNGIGKIRVDDSTWKVEGADCPAGTRVHVVGVDGVILKVESVS